MHDSVELYRQKVHMDHLQSLARFKATVNLARSTLKELVDFIEGEGSAHPIYLRGVRDSLIQTQSFLDTLVFKELPSTQAVRDVMAVSRAVQAAAQMLNEILDKPEIAKLEGFAEIAGDLEEFEPKLQKFHEVFGDNRKTSWLDVFPGDTGFGHGRSTSYAEYVERNGSL